MGPGNLRKCVVMAALPAGGAKKLAAQAPPGPVKLFVDASQVATNALDFVVGMPAYAAGLAPGMRILAVNGQRWSAKAIRDDIRSSEHDPAPITVAVRDDDLNQTFHIEYHGGLRCPHLELIPGSPDPLGEIYEQHVPPAE